MNDNILSRIRQLSQEILPDVQSIRQHLHQYPELSFEEHETMSFIGKQLKKLDIPYENKVAGTGVVGYIRGRFSDKDPHVILRADIDALPIQEENQGHYVSKHPGVMHACGHDAHTANLLGVAKILKQLENELLHPVLLLFQPGEEKAPGGASLILETGILDKQPVKAIYGLHVFPEFEAKHVGFKEGLYMASCDEIHVDIEGKGGHAAMPHQCIDPIQCGIQLIQKIQSELHRVCDPKIPMVVRFGHFEAKGATNVIPDKAQIKGTFRTMNETWRADALERMTVIAKNIELSTGAKVNLRIVKGYPFLENDPKTTRSLKAASQEILGSEYVHDLPIRLTAEDFSFYSHRYPACFLRMGVRNEKRGITHGVHHPKFDIDEDAFLSGMRVMALPAFMD